MIILVVGITVLEKPCGRIVCNCATLLASLGKLENCKQIKQQMRDLPGLSSSDSESESGSVSVVSGAKVTILSLLTLGEVTAVRLTKYLYIPRAT